MTFLNQKYVRNCTTQWGTSITAHGRKYDHAMVSAFPKIRLKSDRRKQQKDFAALRDPDVALRHEHALQEELARSVPPETPEESLKRSQVGGGL